MSVETQGLPLTAEALPERPQQPWPTRFGGKVERVRHYNPETGFAIMNVKTSGGRNVSVLGIPSERPIEHSRIKVRGKWQEDERFGMQFRASQMVLQPPTDLEVLSKYLVEAIKGVGPTTAKRIVEAFGGETESALDDATRLAEIGLPLAAARSISEQWHSRAEERELILYLRGLGLGPSLARRAVNKFGPETIQQRLSTNPYMLTEVPGIGFKIADGVALSSGFAADSHFRIVAGIRYALEQRATSGHTRTWRAVLVREAAKLLSIAAEKVDGALDMVGRDRDAIIVRTVDGLDVYSLVWFDKAERRIANAVKALVGPRSGMTVPDREEILERFGFPPDPEQLVAISAAMRSGISIITGGPGCGKTTIVRVIAALWPGGVVLAAPTGKAAKRLAEATGIREASTIHRLLEAKPDGGSFAFERNEDNPLELTGKILIVDEGSMMDVRLTASLFLAIPDDARVVIVGDANQLPSVGAGNVLANLIDAGVPTTVLRHIHRTGAGSSIPYYADQVKNGIVPDLPEGGGTDARFVRADSNTVVIDVLREVIASGESLDDVQIIAPVWKGAFGGDMLNVLVQRAFNPEAADNAASGISTGRKVAVPLDDGLEEDVDERVCIGDRVMQIANDYELEIFNGEQMRVKDVSPEKRGGRRWIDVLVDIGDGQFATERIDADGMEDIRLSYASTVHKFQGDQKGVIIVVLKKAHYRMLNRKLLYTAMTRAKRLLIVVGDRRAISLACDNAGGEDMRDTALLDYLVDLEVAA